MKKIKLTKLIKQLNAEHEPPGGWRASDQADKPTSCQAQSLQDLDPTIDWNKFLKELTS